ncbi:MAG: nucleoside hydrolase [Xanthomonadales bacterium]|nr:nucleoside hydrolase [Xanthomonadales bacterium]
MTARRVIVDCDPGQDDFINLMLIAAAPELFEVIAITTVAGNVGLSLTTHNARLACDWAGWARTPVYAGCPAPLMRPLATAEHVHGATGLDGLAAAEPGTPLDDSHAVPAMIDALRGADAPITLIATGPLTNIATALIMAPDIADGIEQIVLMGGARRAGGNITPSAEFNMAVDPHVASRVAAAGIPLVVLGLDVTHQLRMTGPRRARLREIGRPVTTAVADMLDSTTARMNIGLDDGPPLHDPCTALFLIDPMLFDLQDCHLAVETDSPMTYGHTLVDLDGATGRPINARWATTIDDEAAFACIEQRLAGLAARAG